MDLNLTGTIVTNVSLMQASNKDYLPLITQIITTLLAASVTLASVFFAQYLSAKSEARKNAEEQNEQMTINRRNAYQNFLDIFSSPIKSNINWSDEFSDITRDHLKIALIALEFGDQPANPYIQLNVSNASKEIRSLGELTQFLLELRYALDLCQEERIRVFKSLKIQAATSFSSAFLSILCEQTTIPEGISQRTE